MAVDTAGILTDRLTIPHKGETYEFRIPAIHDDIKIGIRVRSLQKALDPNWDGGGGGLDFYTQQCLRASATFELLLASSTAKWPWSQGTGGVVCDSAKFPRENAGDVIEIVLGKGGFDEKLGFFRQNGTTDGIRPGTETVEGKSGS